MERRDAAAPSVRLIPPIWAECRRCRYRENCPHFLDHALYYTTQQCRDSTRLLSAEADRLLAALSCANDVGTLRHADEALERTLSQVLRSECSWADP